MSQFDDDDSLGRYALTRCAYDMGPSGRRCKRRYATGALWCWQHYNAGEAYLKAHQLPRPQ